MACYLFLTYRMAKGYGVDVAVAAVSRRLLASGNSVVIGCVDVDGTYKDLDVVSIAGDLGSTATLISSLNPDVIVLNTAPFFDFLKPLKKRFPAAKWVVWEYGDPTPELFSTERKAREEEKKRKQEDCYALADALVTISKFVSIDIGSYPRALPLLIDLLGCDHVPDRGEKNDSDFSAAGTALRVGTLARLGRGEAFYKGTAIFVQLIEELEKRRIPVVPAFLGRGTNDHAKHLRQRGYEIHLNASDAEKHDYLRKLDVFVSCSQWEGFNLPLVEAEALGTASLAFELGAHPEVTPLTFANLNLMVEQIAAYAHSRQLLREHSQMCYQFARSSFKWEKTAEDFETFVRNEVLKDHKNSSSHKGVSLVVRGRLFAGKVLHLIRVYGFWTLSQEAMRRILSR